MLLMLRYYITLLIRLFFSPHGYVHAAAVTLFTIRCHYAAAVDTDYAMMLRYATMSPIR